MADPTLYLFDGYNILHAGWSGDRGSLVDRLVSFVALSGARGVLVFDGRGDDAVLGPLEVRFTPDADALLERLAVAHRRSERVMLVTSDEAVLGTAGREVARRSAHTFLRDLPVAADPPARSGELAERLDEVTRARLERLRRGDQ